MRDLKKTSKSITHYDTLEAPIGTLLLAGCENYLRFASFATGRQARQPLEHWEHSPTMFTQAKTELSEYFQGERRNFDVPIKLSGTDFQKAVWQALIEIPFGETRSYGEIAKAIQNVKASRAVGGANNANPIPVIVPCHRVIGADKSLTGFGGGIPTKEFLLNLEGGNF